jgi:hypothetical protein
MEIALDYMGIALVFVPYAADNMGICIGIYVDCVGFCAVCGGLRRKIYAYSG